MAENNQNNNIEEINALPLLPLRGLTVFPNMVLHFDVGRKVSVKALEQAMLKNQMIFLTAQKDMNSENPKQGDVYKIGTIAKVKQLLRLPGDTIRVLVEGIKRAQIVKFTQTDPYFLVEVKEIAEKKSRISKNELEALMRQIIMTFESYAKLTNRIAPEIAASIEAIEEPARLSDIVASNLFLKVDSKQELLSENNIKRRLILLLEIMSKEIEILQIEREISSKVKKQIDKNQKEYYLREQLKAIQDELGDGESWNSEIEDYKERLALGGYPVEVEEKLVKELGRLKKMHSSAAEGSVIRNYIECVLDLPWSKKTEEILSIELASKILEKEHYGLEKVKERIIEFLAVRKLKDSLKGPIICLVGPPGVGKTSIAKSVAHALNRKYVRLSLGGVRDEAEIRGHRRTYVGAMPGRIINALKQAGTKNPLVLLDEIDKMSSDFRGDPASAMLEVLDGEQNFSFRDHYLELPFDLSDVLFLTTANNLSTIPRPLLDRMEVIDISGYTEEEKVNIAEMYLIPKQIKEHGLLKKQIRLESVVVRDIINYYTREAGVRGLERSIAKVCRKAAKTIIAEDRKVITITQKNLTKYLGIKRYSYDKACRIDEVGIARGLAWTPVGGDTLSIEVNLMKGEGKIELTGQLGDVMKESAKIAISYIRSRADELGIENEFYKKYDIHVHVPEGATPKDGPSAGITLATSLISALTGIPVRRCVAMTGEITLRGKVLPIGGVKEKVLAAHRAGITTIILPSENEKDISEIPETVSKNLKFIIAENMECVLQTALTSMPIPLLKDVDDIHDNKDIDNKKCQGNIQSEASIAGIASKTTVIKQ